MKLDKTLQESYKNGRSHFLFYNSREQETQSEEEAAWTLVA